MKTKITKGPWVATGVCIIDGHGECLLVCVNGAVKRGDEQEDYATAHLIAAAPELYEALEAIKGEVSLELWKAVDGEKALAKARGEQP